MNSHKILAISHLDGRMQVGNVK